jgi:hypothetical protein
MQGKLKARDAAGFVLLRVVKWSQYEINVLLFFYTVIFFC